MMYKDYSQSESFNDFILSNYDKPSFDGFLIWGCIIVFVIVIYLIFIKIKCDEYNRYYDHDYNYRNPTHYISSGSSKEKRGKLYPVLEEDGSERQPRFIDGKNRSHGVWWR